MVRGKSQLSTLTFADSEKTSWHIGWAALERERIAEGIGTGHSKVERENMSE
jgi:hypothetical protein